MLEKYFTGRDWVYISCVCLGNPNGLGDFLTSSRHFDSDSVWAKMKSYCYYIHIQVSTQRMSEVAPSHEFLFHYLKFSNPTNSSVFVHSTDEKS